MGLFIARLSYLASAKMRSHWKAVTILLCLLIIFLVMVMMVATQARTRSLLLNSPPHSQVEPRKFAGTTQFLLSGGNE